MYNIFLTDEDLKGGTPYPVLALLNEAANENLIEFISRLISGVGSGYNYTTCYFWLELDDYDKVQTPKFEGLGIETENGDKIIVSYAELVYYLKLLCKRIPDEQTDKNIIEDLIASFENRR